MMHSALGVGLAIGETGWLHYVVAFAKPFRMPDFFIVAGLFLGRAINLPWRTYLDRKVVHFLYFYALWLAIVLVAKANEFSFLAPLRILWAYLAGFVTPFSTMWFIYLLPFLFIAARLVRHWPIALVIAVGVALHIAAARYPDGDLYAMSSVMTGWVLIDSFSLFFVYFLIGHYARDKIFAFASSVVGNPKIATTGLAVWVILEQLSVRSNLTEVPGLTLLFGIAGAIAVITISALMSKLKVVPWLAYCGRHSLVIYLAFVLPMAATRIVLLKSGLISSVGWISVIVAIVAISAPLALDSVVRGTWLAFLFNRPLWAYLPGIDGRPEKARDHLSRVQKIP